MITITFCVYDQPTTAWYYHVIEKPIAQQCPSAHAVLRVCVDALIAREKEKRTEKRRIARVSLHLAWFKL